jgi:hypothetical protein
MLGRDLTGAAQHPEIERRKRGRTSGSMATAKQPATTAEPCGLIVEDRSIAVAIGLVGVSLRIVLNSPRKAASAISFAYR